MVRSREHLVPLATGGDSLPDNLREACRRCNTFVGDWPVERKLKFRVLLLSLGKWSRLCGRFGPTAGRRFRVERYLDAMPLPGDPESTEALETVVRVELRRRLLASLDEDYGFPGLPWKVARSGRIVERALPEVDISISVC